MGVSLKCIELIQIKDACDVSDIEGLIKGCMNEIRLAENAKKIPVFSKCEWLNNIPNTWLELAKQVEGQIKQVFIKNKEFNDERNEKYKNRIIDITKNLFDRNIDIIQVFENRIIKDACDVGDIEGLIKGCMNEIRLAENAKWIPVFNKYEWSNNIPNAWLELAKQVEGQIIQVKLIKNKEFSDERNEKYKSRIIDITKNLFDRNIDIIQIFENKITKDICDVGDIEGLIKECMNEIRLAENAKWIPVFNKYEWSNNIPNAWLELAKQVEGQIIQVFIKNKKFNDKRNKKYKNRVIDITKNLFDRNIDIIQIFENRIIKDVCDVGDIEGLIKECMNEIRLAENAKEIPVFNDCKCSNNIPNTWVKLAGLITRLFIKNKQIKNEILDKKIQLQELNNSLKKSKKIKKHDYETNTCIYIQNLNDILKPNIVIWADTEKQLISYNDQYAEFPLFNNELNNEAIKELAVALNKEICEYNKNQKIYVDFHNENKLFFQAIFDGYKNNEKKQVIERLNFVMNNIEMPLSIPKIWNIDFDHEQSIAIIEMKLPDIVHNEVKKIVFLKHKEVTKSLTQKEAKEFLPQVHPAIIIRTAYEIFRNDILDKIKLLVINGWVEFHESSTGNIVKPYTSSLVVEKKQIMNLNISKLEPFSAFKALKGKSAGKLIDIIPVSPVITLNKQDNRFIETKEILNNLNKQTNLASMDWQDFENLIAELFQKEFSGEGVEIKLTQSSRDRGVDAIVFNPDPIKGGKYVIQAKRYTNIVDVSAVRDLVAVVNHEGASRGILVTTSTYGASAYAFVQNKPITLLDGSQLLGLLEKHGYKFRINIAEAKKLHLNHKE